MIEPFQKLIVLDMIGKALLSFSKLSPLYPLFILGSRVRILNNSHQFQIRKFWKYSDQFPQDDFDIYDEV